MTVAAVHSRYAVQIDVLTPSVPVNLAGISSVQILLNPDVQSQRTGGDVYKVHQTLYSQKPVARFRSACLQDALDQIGLTGLPLTYGGINLYAAKWAENAGIAAGSVHKKYNALSGVVVPRRLTCEHGGDAELEYEVIVTYDGTNNPWVLAETAALPTAPQDNERFTIGAWTIGSVQLLQISRLEIDFGITVQSIGADSDRWDTYAVVRAIEPTITLTGINVNWFADSAIPLTGKVATHANTKGYLRKRSTGATGFVVDGTAEHIQFNADGMAVVESAFEDQGDQPAQSSVKIHLRYDNTNAPLVIDTTAAIT